VCGIESITSKDGASVITRVVSIAGDISDRHVDPKFIALGTGDSSADKERVGVRVVLNGGLYPDDKTGRKQSAIIDFICDPDREGLEGLDGEEYDENKSSLKFISYGDDKNNDENMDTLHLEWRTKHVCKRSEKEIDESNHWGFFTWLFVLYVQSHNAPLIFVFSTLRYLY
jgi:hypothetical protein